MAKLNTIDSLKNLSEKTVIVRGDLDVPVKNGEVTSNYRLSKLAVTIRHLLQLNARVVVLGHKGRPDSEFQDDLSLMPVRFELGKLLGMHIKFAHLPNSRNSIRYMEDSEVLMLENLRFYPEETSKNSKTRAGLIAELGELGDYYVNDAFATYRKGASTIELAKMFDKPLAGVQMKHEIAKLDVLKNEIKSPYVAVIGGAKMDTKIDILKYLIKKADVILLGGAMAYTFLSAQGIEVGDSKVEKDQIKEAKAILKEAKAKGVEILLPVDHIAGKEFSPDTNKVEVDTQHIPAGLIGLDIGERTIANYLETIKGAKTILWNGPMGVFEWENFGRGTEAIGEFIGLSASDDAYKVAGGGDTIAAMETWKINMKNYDHVSTGGGAMMKYIAGQKMPAIELLYPSK